MKSFVLCCIVGAWLVAPAGAQLVANPSETPGPAVVPLAPALPPMSTPVYEGPRWALLDAGQTMKAAAEITLGRYPDCDDATVDEKMVRVYRPDGTGESQDETYQKVLTEKGRRDNRTLTLDYMIPYSSVEVVKVEVIKPSGQVVPVDVTANSKEMIDDSQMEMNIYDPNSRILKVNIPQLDIGDVVHSVTRTNTLRPIIPGEYSDENVFESPSYIRHLSYEVEAPRAKPLVHRILRDEVPGTVQYSSHPGADGTLVHHWDVHNVPRMFAEPAMPSASVVLQRLLISTIPDWSVVSQWYWNVCQSHLAAQDPGMKKTVDEAMVGAHSEMEKIQSIYYYVSKKIRYMGLTPEKDRPGFEPHDVRLTYCNKYGVCRDKAALLVAMLRLVGVDAYPVLTSYGAKRDQEVPSPDFNHAIVAVDQGQRNYLLLDPTDENSRVLFPSTESDQSFLVARPEGDTLRTSPVVPPDQNMLKVVTQATLDDQDRIVASSQISFEGYNDNAYREVFSQMKPDDRRRFFEQRLKAALPGARLVSLAIDPVEMTDVSANISAHLQFTLEHATARGDGKGVINLPWIGRKLGVVNFILSGTGLEKRKYPMQTYVACGVQETIHLQLGNQFTAAVSVPDDHPIEDHCLSAHRHLDFQNGTLEATREFKLNVVEFSPAEYLQLKQSLAALADDDRKYPVLAMAPGAGTPKEGWASAPAFSESVESNALILDSEKVLTVQDAHHAVYHAHFSKRILNYSGKKDESEIKIPFNPAYEEVRIVKAAVTGKDGQPQSITPDEINVLDDSWNASAKRYTGGKILVANLPAVDVGSTIEVEYEQTLHDAPFIAGFEPFQLKDSLQKKSLVISAPSSLKLQTSVSKSALATAAPPARHWWSFLTSWWKKEKEEPQDLTAQATSEGGTQKLSWEASQVRGLPKEDSLPPDWKASAGVSYFVGDSSEYLNQISQALQDRSDKSPKAKALAGQLAGNAFSQLDAVRTIRDYVAKNIRQAGPSFTKLPLSELSSGDVTLTDGYGHGADIAILLHAMLASLGLNPEFVLASNLPAVPGIQEIVRTFPFPDEFTDVLVKVKVDGQSLYLNDTNQYAELGISHHRQDLAFNLHDQAFETIQVAAPNEDRVESFYTISLTDAGQITVAFEHHYFGGPYGEKHQFFAEMPPEERKRFQQKLVSSIAQGARPVGDLFTDFNVYPGVEKYTVAIDRYGVVAGPFMYFDLPFPVSLFSLTGDERSLPWMVSSAKSHLIHAEIHLPASFPKVAIAPVSASLQAPGGLGQAMVTASATPGQYSLSYDLEQSPGILPARDYPKVLNLETRLGTKFSRFFLLEK